MADPTDRSTGTLEQQESDRATRRGSRRRIVLGAVVAVLVLLVLGVVSIVGRSDPGGTGSPSGQAGPSGQSGPAATGGGAPGASAPSDPVTAARLAVPRRQDGDPLALGRVDAPVVVAEWGDFQCPFCRLFSLRDEPALRAQYVDTGRVRVEWHDYAYLGPESVLGARAARAAGRQGKFWPFHDALYRDQPRENSGSVTDASLTATAGRLGLDVARFERDYRDPTITQAVEADQEAGGRLGVNGVPSFVIGPQLIFGAQPLATFQQAIDGALGR